MTDLIIKKEVENIPDRKDPTSFLPEEPMSYEIKKKKKKKKKKKQEDPFKDLEENVSYYEPTLIDPEVNIKVENIEVDLDFNDFADNSFTEGTETNENINLEPAIKIEENNHDAVLLTFESIIHENTPSIEYNDIQPFAKHACSICHLVFQNEKTLRVHQNRKHEGFRKYFLHICDFCGMSYQFKNSLIAHIRRKHEGKAEEDNEEKACETCGLFFKGEGRLRLHKRRKHGSFKESFNFVCDDCGLTYEKECSLLVHIRRKHPKVPKKISSNEWYKCPLCPKIYNRRETYARHIQRTHKVSDDKAVPQELSENQRNAETGEIMCHLCPLMFSSINFLKLHMRRKHNALRENFRYKCKICSLSYDRVESLKRHVHRKHDKRTYCEICNRHFTTKEAYFSHTHSKVIKECTICGLIFASQGGLAKHMRCTHKIESKNKFFCHICNKGFHEKRQLKPHMLKVHLKASYTCVICNKVFKARESYRRHILNMHPNNPLNVQVQKCEHCLETFKDEFELSRHIYTSHGGIEMDPNRVIKSEIKKEEDKDVFQCTKCSESLESFELMRLHYEQNHQTVTETQCQVCGELLPTNELQKHIKTVHIANEMMNCRYCDFKTTAKVSMTQHLLRHTNAETLHCDFPNCKYKSFYESAMEKHRRRHRDQGVKLQCSQCPFQTMNKYILKYHEEAHVTGKKRYTCNQCDYATILPANLVQHKYKHSTEKRFKCEVCPFATKYNTSLRFHVKKKHCDLPSFP